MLDRLLDIFGNMHIGSFTRISKARITVDPRADDTDGIGLDIEPTRAASGRRAVVKLGDYTFGQDTAKSGSKNFGLLNADGTLVSVLANGNGSNPNRSCVWQTNIPLIIAPTGSVADGGVLTSGTANPLTFLKTYTYFPLAALTSAGTTPPLTDSPAGWYYTVWTTTTAAQVYNNMWDGISEPTIPTTLTSFSAVASTGPGAFTGPTTNAMYANFPMLAANVDSIFDVEMKLIQTNNANAKTVTVRFSALAGTLLWTNTTTSFLENDGQHTLKVNGVSNKQSITGKTFGSTAYVRQASALAAETTSAAFSFAVCASKADATDVAVIESIRIFRTR